MLKQVKIGFMALLAVAFLASCQSANNDARDAARTAVEQQAPVQPANTSQAQQATQAEPAVPAGPTTEMTFAETTFDFGTITEGEKVAHTYSFTNTGNEPLILSNAKGSCGCTVPKWPREPIAPGQSAEITVEFNSKNKKGKRNQKVTVTANTNPPQTFIYLTGDVAAGEGAPAVNQ
ncbi:MAG: DUF1573 domain-containing protein [Saprospiraceae bacterium]|jgi:hypothetical protein|nr:DUF1573 domain-containing protein [Saprospiraceae bacterium]